MQEHPWGRKRAETPVLPAATPTNPSKTGAMSRPSVQGWPRQPVVGKKEEEEEEAFSHCVTGQSIVTHPPHTPRTSQTQKSLCQQLVWVGLWGLGHGVSWGGGFLRAESAFPVALSPCLIPTTLIKTPNLISATE